MGASESFGLRNGDSTCPAECAFDVSLSDS
ncbi:hypothetical protein ACVWW6_009083 [Bradyrhizobium sp. USDA 3311]